MIACLIVLALLNLLIATDPEPGESGFPRAGVLFLLFHFGGGSGYL